MDHSPSRIAALATEIVEGTNRIDSYLRSNGLPSPSFEVDGPGDLKLTPELQDTRASILAANEELQELLLGPGPLMYFHHRYPFFFYDIIGRFEIAKKVPINDEISYTDLATAVGVNEAALTHILRYAIAFRVFCEKRPGYISHSASSKILVEYPDMQIGLDFFREEILAKSLWVGRALEKYPDADEPEEAACLLAEASDQKTIFDLLAQHPRREQRFATSMKVFSRFADLPASYPWDNFGSGTVVDVGGSHGGNVFSVARKFPNLNLIVQDLPQVVATAQQQEGLNVTFMAHDFFAPQPVKDADAYIYRRCFHDWPDKYCVRMLKAAIPALKPGARLLIIDMILAPFGSQPNRMERDARAMDMTMHMLQNAKERDLEEWKNLFAAADPRFQLDEVRREEGSMLAILDVVWRP